MQLLKFVDVALVGAKVKECEDAVKISIAVHHGVNPFAEWNPKLNSDEMNVLINW